VLVRQVELMQKFQVWTSQAYMALQRLMAALDGGSMPFAACVGGSERQSDMGKRNRRSVSGVLCHYKRSGMCAMRVDDGE